MVHCYCILCYSPHHSTTYICTLLQSTQLCYSLLFNPLYSTLTKCILVIPNITIMTNTHFVLFTTIASSHTYWPSHSLTHSITLLFTSPSHCPSHRVPMTLSPQALTWVTTRSVADRSWFDLADLADTCRSAWMLRRTGRPTHCLSGCITQHPWRKY